MKVIFLCLFLIDISLGNNNYPHLVEKAVFPPVLSKAENSDEAVGHKKPLGSQNAPQGPIIEYDKFLEPKTLWEKHVDPHIPLVYRGAIKDSPAVKEWVKDEYLTEKYGDLDVLVEHKKEDRSSTSGRMTLKDFLKHYKTDDLYVVSMFPSEMMGEVKAINSIMCGTFRNFTHESNLWISAGGTRSVVHYDADHNFHCVIDGRKDFIMIPNNLATKTNLYFKQKDPGVGSGFSFLDPDSIDMKKFPKIAKVPWTWATLYPGDCIFIPSIYIHQVRGYGRTLAVTTLFTADIQDNFNADDCPSDITQKDYTMADINFLWTYKKGDPTIDMGYMNTELVKNQLLDALDDDVIKDGKMTMKQFILFTGTFSPYGRNRTKMAAVWKDIFKIAENGYLDAKKVKSLDLHQMKIFCRAVESPHGVVTNGSEPVFVRPGERHKWEKATDYEEDASDRYEEDEDEIRRLTHYDNMLQHLSDEERQAYIEKRREEKQKFGVQYDGDHMDLSQLSEPARILMQLSWRIDDIPEEHHPHILRGRIPEDFRDEFLSALPESLLEKYEKYFERDRIPKVMVKALIAAKRDNYTKRMREELESEEGESEEGESEELESEEERNEESKKDEL